MSMHRLRRLCKGGLFLLFICLMSISLTGCAWLAALAPILSAIGSVTGMVGSIVSIFSPETGSKISQVGNAISSTGQSLQGVANETGGRQTGQTTSSVPTGTSAPTTSEDGTTISSSATTGTSSTSSSSSTGTTSGATSAPAVAAGGSAASNAQSMLSSGFINRGSKAFDGRLNITQYGGPSDRTKDKYTEMGLGNRNNKLRPTSLALSPDLIRKYGLKGGESIYIKTPQGTRFLGHYDDTTGNKSEPNVIDIYDKTDSLGQDNFLATIPKGQWELVIGR